jgi:hypothetical protein
MTLEQTPATARTDVRRTTAAGTTTPARPFYKRGMVLTTGAVAWGLDSAILGSDPHGKLEEALSSITSGTFQLGILGLLTVLWTTKALDAGRLARFFLRLEGVVLALAMGSTLVDGIGVSDLDKVGWVLLDLCWPLSTLGMFLIGIRIAIAGRWHGRSLLAARGRVVGSSCRQPCSFRPASSPAPRPPGCAAGCRRRTPGSRAPSRSRTAARSPATGSPSGRCRPAWRGSAATG